MPDPTSILDDLPFGEPLTEPNPGAAPRVLAIDPGSEQSAWVDLQGGRPVAFGIEENATLLIILRLIAPPDGRGVIVIESIESYGMPVGREVFDTVHWSGRFTEAAHPTPVVQVPRREVKLALCHDTRAKDANVRQALLDRFGGKVAAVGNKANPGPLYGISRDVWQALAVGVAYLDRTP
jgi:hypothetical protein